MSDNSLDADLIEGDVPHYTARRPVLAGSFNISRASIPYYLATIPLADAVRDLDLVENLPADLRAHWRLEELFQREIDWERVQTEIVDGYLRRPEKLQFFNALTVALLPTTPEKHLRQQYQTPAALPDVPERYLKAPWCVQQIGGVELISNTNSAHGYVSWNPQIVYPATIDGQHRLAALKELVARGNLTSTQLSTSVSVLFLILDERAGYKISEQQGADDDNPILTAVREIFIDLNRSAKMVVRARQILLNDQEIESRAVRSLLAPRVGVEVPGRLPLGLVHWQHNVSAKFNSGAETGPFVTTVELLHLIVTDLLRISRPKDPFDENQVRQFVLSAESALGVSDAVAAAPARYPGLPKLMNYVERNYLKEGFEQPFANLPAPYLHAADEGFALRWRPLLVGILTRFAPYRDFIEQVRIRGGIDGDLAHFLCQPTRAQIQMAKEWADQKFEKIDRPLKELASLKNKDWPFFAVFQKGMFRAAADALAQYPVQPGAEISVEEFVEKWLDFLHVLQQRDLLEVRASLPGGTGMLWAGLALNPGSKTIRWSDSSVQRIAAILLLWWYVQVGGFRRLGSFLKAARGPKSKERFPGAKRAIEIILRSLKTVVVSADEDDVTEEELAKRSERRLTQIVRLALSDPGATTDGESDDDDTSAEDAEIEDGDDSETVEAEDSEPE